MDIWLHFVWLRMPFSSGPTVTCGWLTHGKSLLFLSFALLFHMHDQSSVKLTTNCLEVELCNAYPANGATHEACTFHAWIPRPYAVVTLVRGLSSSMSYGWCVKSIDFLSLFNVFWTLSAVKRAAGCCAQHSVISLAIVWRDCWKNQYITFCFHDLEPELNFLSFT